MKEFLTLAEPVLLFSLLSAATFVATQLVAETPRVLAAYARGHEPTRLRHPRWARRWFHWIVLILGATAYFVVDDGRSEFVMDGVFAGIAWSLAWSVSARLDTSGFGTDGPTP